MHTSRSIGFQLQFLDTKGKLEVVTAHAFSLSWCITDACIGESIHPWPIIHCHGHSNPQESYQHQDCSDGFAFHNCFSHSSASSIKLTANADVEESQPCRTFSTLPFSQLARRRFKARRGAGGGAAWLDFIQGEMQLGLILSCSDLEVIVR